MDVWYVYMMNTTRLVGHLLSLVSLLVIHVIRSTLANEQVATLSPKQLAQVRDWTKSISNYNMHRVA